MRSVIALVTLALTGLGCLAGCLRAPWFQCAQDTECGAGGTCEPVGFCSFPDTSCDSGRRFAPRSGPVGKECVAIAVDGGVVDMSLVDAAQPDARPIDAPPPGDCSATPTLCTAQGGICIGATCQIDQNGGGGVTCPTGMPCVVICNVTDACKNGVNCAGATSCDVQCIGNGACQDRGVDCGSAGTCTVLCDGDKACQNGNGANVSVECRASTCSVTCKGTTSTCQEGIAPGTGTCTSHCCNGACSGGTCPTNDNVCP